MSLPIISSPDVNASLFKSSSSNTQDRKSTSDDTESSFSSYLKLFSGDDAADTPQADVEITQLAQPAPTQIQIPLAPVVQSAPLTAELRLNTVSTDGADAAIIHSASSAHPKSDHKDQTPTESQPQLPVLEMLAVPSQLPQPVPVPAKEPIPTMPVEVAEVIKPSIQSNLRVMDDQKTIARKIEPSGKPAESQEIAFTATIKEAVQPAKSQYNGGQDRPSREHTPNETIQPSTTPALNAPEKPVTQTLAQAKTIDAPKLASPSPLVHPVLDDHAVAAPGAANSISLKVESLNSGVDIKLMERGGVIQVSVRTADRELTGDIRGRLNELVDSLAGKGYETRTWTPETLAANRDPSMRALDPISSTFQSQNEPRNSNQGEPGKGNAFQEPSGGKQSKGDRREPEQQNGRHEKPKNIFRTVLEGARP